MNQKTALIELDKILNEMIKTPMGRRAFLGSVGLLMASCATPEKTRYREGSNRGQDTDLTVEDEKRLTREVLPKMRQEYPSLNNVSLQTYVRGVGQKVVAANRLQGNPYDYNFTVVDVPYVNAFALPAGTVFVTTTLIAMAESEAELAGVIGHEIGHIQARHTAERMDAAKKAEGQSWIFGAAGGVLGGALGYGLGRMMCRQGDNECLTKAAMYGAAAGAGGGLLIQRFKFMANSREDEMEADRIGFRTAIHAGYDKDACGLFYAKLLKMEQQSKGNQDKITAALADAMSTHPPSQERVDQMKELANSTPRNPRAIVNTAAFDQMRALALKLSKQPQRAS
jgi:predicted Zn-dependent protease